MCSGKGSAVGAEIAAVVFLVLSAFISIGAMAGSYKVLSVPKTDFPGGSCSEQSYTFYATASEELKGGQMTRTTYAEAKCEPSILSATACALIKNAVSNGGAAVAMFAIALLFSLASAVFISLRVVRLRQNLLRSSNDASSPQAAPKGCHTRAAASVTLSVLAFVLMLVAAITVWVGVLPLAAWFFANLSFPCSGLVGVRPITLADGPGAACAGIVIFTSFMAMVLDASSHCCCKSAGKGMGVAGGPTTVVVMPPMAFAQQGYAPAYPQQGYAPQQQHFAEPHRTTVYAQPA